MARPAIDEQHLRSHWLKVRVSQEELDAIEAKRAAAGMSRSAYVRSAAMNGAILRREPLADQQLIRALAACGNNLNQIARTGNIAGNFDPEMLERLNEALDQNAAIIEELTG